MISLTLFLYFPLILAVTLNKREDPAWYWQFPPQPEQSGFYGHNLVLPLGSTQYLKWAQPTNLSEYNMYIIENSSSFTIPVYSKHDSEPEEEGISWTVDVGTVALVPGQTKFFYFWVGAPGARLTQGFTSHYFNVTNAGVFSSSSSSSIPVTSLPTSTLIQTSASTTASSTFTSSPTSAAQSPTSTPSPTAATQSPNSSSGTNKLALGLGLGLGIPVVLLLGIYVGIKLAKSRRSTPVQPGYTQEPAMEAPHYAMPEYAPRAELETELQRRELM